MAKPDTDDGWYKKSIELEAALDYADFSKMARTILRFGFSQIFGVGRRPRYIKLESRDVIARTGKTKQEVYRGFLELINAKVFDPIEGSPNTYRFVKDYELWRETSRVKGLPVTSCKSRLSPREIADCKGAIGYAMSFKDAKDTDETVSHLADPSAKAVVTLADPSKIEVSHLADQESARMTTKVSQNDYFSGSPYVPPIRKRVEIKENTEPVPDFQTESDKAGDWAIAKIQDARPGDDSLAEIVYLKAVSWVRDEKYTVTEVQAAIIKAIDASISGAGFTLWAHKALCGARDKSPKAPAPKQPSKPVEFWKASPRPTDAQASESAWPRPRSSDPSQPGKAS